MLIKKARVYAKIWELNNDLLIIINPLFEIVFDFILSDF